MPAITPIIKPLRIFKDLGGNSALVRCFPEWVDTLFLGIATNLSYTIPTGAQVLYFSYTGPVYVRQGGVAVVPVGTVVDGSGSVLSPASYSLALDQNNAPQTLLGFISAAAQTVTIEAYRFTNDTTN